MHGKRMHSLSCRHLGGGGLVREWKKNRVRGTERWGGCGAWIKGK